MSMHAYHAMRKQCVGCKWDMVAEGSCRRVQFAILCVIVSMLIQYLVGNLNSISVLSVQSFFMCRCIQWLPERGQILGLPVAALCGPQLHQSFTVCTRASC